MRFKTFYLIFSILCISLKSYSQESGKSIPVTGDWESGGYILENAEMNVEIEYKLQKESCDPGGFGNANHQFRFKIEAKKKPLGEERFLSFKIMFEDCFGVKICKTVNLNIGVRQKFDIWDGIQPLADPNGDNSFIARKLLIPFYDVNLRWEKDPTKDAECDGIGNIPTVLSPKSKEQTGKIESVAQSVSPLIKAPIKLTYDLPKSIGLKSSKLFCAGAMVKFFPIGGRLDSLLKYQWTKTSFNGEIIFEGDTLEVYPTESNVYFLKIIGPEISVNSSSVKYNLKQIPLTKLPFLKEVLENNRIKIEINHSSIKGNFPVSWYKNGIDNNHKIDTKSYTLEDEYQKGDIYYYRFESSCDTSEITEVSFPEIKFKSNFLIQLNVGATILGGQKIQPYNYMLVLGSKKWAVNPYVRIKKQQSGPIGTISPLYESNNIKITNYPPNTNTYYVLTDKTVNKRDSYTGGITWKLGGSKLKIYLGGGLGTNEVYWNAQTFAYPDPNKLSLVLNDVWFKNKSQLFSGIEGEAGLMLNLGPVNILGGVNMLKGDSGIFITSDVGIGITF